MGVSTSPQPSPPSLQHHLSSPHLHHLNSPPSSPSQAAAVHASECFDKEGLVAAHWTALHDAHVLEKRLHHVEGTVSAPTPSLPPKNAKPILIRDLKLGKVHRGRALNATLCTHSLKVHTVYNVLEDETGMATKLRIRNALPVNYSMLQAQRLYPKGSKIALLDPYLTEFSDGTIGILVEKPSDIVFLWVPEVAEGDLHKLQESDAVDDPVPEPQETGKSEDIVLALECNDLPVESEILPVDSSPLPAEDDSTAEKSTLAATDNLNGLPVESETEQLVKVEIPEIKISEDADNEGVSNCSNSNLSSNGASQIPRGNMDFLDGMKSKSSSLDEVITKVDEVPPVEEKREGGLLVDPDISQKLDGATTLKDSFLDTEIELDRGLGTDKIDLKLNGQHLKGDVFPLEEDETGIEDPKVEPGAEPISLKSGAEANGDSYGSKNFADPLDYLDARSLRIRGNGLFSESNWIGAADLYTRAIRKAEIEMDGHFNSAWRDGDEVLLGYTNRSEAWLRLKQFSKAQADAEKALARSPNHAKSLFRMGRAYLGQGKQSEALPFLQAAKKLAPYDTDLQEAIKQCRSSTQRPKAKSKKKQLRV